MSAQSASLPTQIPIVVFGDDWGRHPSSMQHLFRHVARTHDVIWVNSIGHRVPRLSARDIRRVASKIGVLFRGGRTGTAGEIDLGIQPRSLVQPRVLPWHHHRVVRVLNGWSLTRAIQGALGHLGLTERPLLVTGTPPSVSVLGRLGEIATIYYCMDDFLHLPDVSPEMLRPLERELLDRADAVVATAQALVASKAPRSGRAYYLPQGVNFEHFATLRPVPPELAGLPKPLIGFAGGLTTSVDLPLIGRLAKAYPAASVVLIGPIKMDLSSIAAPNVHVLGPRPYKDLPAYVQAFDVGTIPYVLNEHTVAVDPLKLLEYMAARVPVVTTDLPEARKYSDSVAIASDHDAFVDAVQRATAVPAEERVRRQASARQHGWDRRAEQLLGIFGQVVATAATRSP